MSKIANKAKRKGLSVHSRAARRAVSPPLRDKQAQVITETTYTPSENATTYAQPQGIRKKKKQQQTRGQKRRLEKTLDRALVVMEQMQAKVSKSEGKLKSVRERRKDWEDINGDRKKKNSEGSRFSILNTEDDEDMEDEKIVEIPLRTTQHGEAVTQKNHELIAADEDEDIL